VPDIPLAISDWTRTEFVSAVGMKVRDKATAEAEAHRAIDRFDTSVMVHWTVWPVEAAEFGQAGDLLARFDLGLRAGDALHLSIARKRGVRQLASLDNGMSARREHSAWTPSTPVEPEGSAGKPAPAAGFHEP